MQELENILKEIDETIERYGKNPYIDEKVTDMCYGLNIAKNIIRKHTNNGWIPVEERLPETNNYILLSFANFSLPMLGRYDEGLEGGSFYLGDCDEEDTCISQDLFVNDWMPLPEPYRPERSE